MTTTAYWILLTDTTTARIYSTSSLKLNKPFTLVTELRHSEGFKRNQDLVSDAPGHYQTNHAARGSYTSKHTPKEIESSRFAQKIVELLEKERASNQFHTLILVCAPHFLGLLKEHFSHHCIN